MNLKKTKLIILLKFLILISILIYQGFIRFGEKNLGAQDNPDTVVEEERISSPVDDLLNLPKIDTRTVKKRELDTYLSTIEEQKAILDEKLNTLEERKKNLLNIEKSIEEKLSRLEQDVAFFEASKQKEKQLQLDRLEKLVNFYQKMSPKKAAPLFEKLDKDLAVSLLQQISDKKSTEILGLMDPQKSVELTEYFGRIESTKEYQNLKEINKSLLEEFEICKSLQSVEASK